MNNPQGFDSAMKLWLLFGWLLVSLACLGMVRRRTSQAQPFPLDPCLWALGLMATATVVPALLLELGRIILYPREWAFILASFPLVWFVTFGGGTALLVTSGAGFNPSRDGGGQAWMWVITVQALLATMLLAAWFSREIRPSPLPRGPRILKWWILANSLLGFLPLMLVVLDD